MHKMTLEHLVTSDCGKTTTVVTSKMTQETTWATGETDVFSNEI